ncbi:uncharacterized protein LOC104877720 isoform X1 [Vitis vinifera]|uniref:Protein ALP1-like n=1 Tax=Vitis vinifera TaxID=29760 RepID=A0A438CFP0_VITVI|nr:uncharacterized protein LOC104877720 isoform X1 [Vitis vinifera]XP_059591595.1 uncharacterized protein LOC104877720 isoform X1 [Vitis vinifera]RVW22028.1 Protein ALP1-like [Vitis vinifera]
MNDNNTSSGELYDSTSSSEEGDDLDEIFIAHIMNEYEEIFLCKTPQRTSMLSGAQFVRDMIEGHPQTCYELFRMDKETFMNLCDHLKRHENLQDTRFVTVEEAVAMFLLIVGHNVRMRVVADRFQHSTETVARHFKEVRRALCRLGKILICPNNMTNEVSSYVASNPKYFPWFKDCIGAIDGTHISAWVPADRQTSFRGRKTVITQNVMCACNFDMMFTFVYAGWEGTANDARVFLDALTRPEVNFPWPSEGKYYVVDSGYPCISGFLPPYRGERYHLQEYRGRHNQPIRYKELFNYRHSSLRNIIERCFGVLKTRFPILRMMPCYKPSRQPSIVVACCTLHNWIRLSTRNDQLFREYEVEDLSIEGEEESTSSRNHSIDLSDESAAVMAACRDQIAEVMWANYINVNP